MALYMKYGPIKGPVTTQGFDGWIELNSFQIGVSRSINTAARGALSREHSEPSFSEVTVTKFGCIGSPKILLDAAAGKLDNKVTIKFTTTNKGDVVTYLTFDFIECGVSHYSMSSGGDMPMETLSINYTEMSETFTGMDPGISGSPETVGYDLKLMKTK
jgi:type VI secretion system secreted protein Hcp